jgi:molybdenum cofactor cytidylyltransferase
MNQALTTEWDTVSGNATDCICAVILAAGESSRFGRLKQIEPVGMTCLLGVVVGNALRCAGIEKVVLVLGAGAEAVKDALGGIIDDDRLVVVFNKDYSKGMSASLRAGLAQARTWNCDAALFLLGDMPMIDADVLDMMIARYRSSDCMLCYAKADDRAGHPIIARKDLFDELMNVEGDIGGREVVRRNAGLSVAVDMGRDYQLDINDTRDMKTFLSHYRERDVSYLSHRRGRNAS